MSSSLSSSSCCETAYVSKVSLRSKHRLKECPMQALHQYMVTLTPVSFSFRACTKTAPRRATLDPACAQPLHSVVVGLSHDMCSKFCSSCTVVSNWSRTLQVCSAVVTRGLATLLLKPGTSESIVVRPAGKTDSGTAE